MMNFAPTTIHCGYCDTAHPSSRTCTCPEQQRMHQARKREIEARYELQRVGIAANERKQYVRERN